MSGTLVESNRIRKRNSDANRLPKGWTTVRIGDVLDLVNGVAFKASDWSKEGLPIIRIQNLNRLDAPFNYTSKTPPEKFRVRKGDLLFAWSGTPGTSFGAHIWNGGDAWLNQHIFRVGFDKRLFEPTFLKLALNHNLGEYISQAHGGAGLAHITRKNFEASFLLLPPLAEQLRIVARLEGLSFHSSKATNLLNELTPAIPQARQSLLTAAFQGDLTRTWRKKARVSNHWLNKRLGDVIAEKPKNGYSALSVNHPTQYRVLSLSATTSGRFDSRHFKYISGPIPEDSSLWLMPGDLLVQRGNTREYVGVTAIYDGPPKAFIYPDLMMKLRANDTVMTEFLYFALSRPEARTFLRNRATGTAGNMPKINQPILMDVPIPLPSKAEQHEIVKLLSSSLNHLDFTEQAKSTAIARLDRLSQSLLAEAMAGRLVSQDPEEESSYDLATRIKAERIITFEETKVLQMKRQKKRASKGQDTISILKDAQVPLSPEELFGSSGKGHSNFDDVEHFYAEIRSLIEKGAIKEIRAPGGQTRLKANL